MSQESAADVAQAAFSLGALGYVVKAHAGRELLTAVEAVCQGRQFVSEGLSSHNWGDPETPGDLFYHEVPSSSIHSHEVQFYRDDAAFLLGFACFIEAALTAGNPVIVVATEWHLNGLLQTLLARGVDVVAATEPGLFLTLDVDEALSTFMVNDSPDPLRFLTVFGDLLTSVTRAAKGKPPRVAACGEFGARLWAQGKADAAMQVEHLTDEVAKSRNVDILCGYVLSSFQRNQKSHIYERICAEHSAVRS